MTIRFRMGAIGMLMAAVVVTACVLSTFSGAVAAPVALDKADGDGGPELQNQQKSEGGIKPAGAYARANYIWPFSTGPNYGTVDPSQRRAPGVLVTNVGSFKLAEVSLPEELRTANKLAQQASQYFIVQFDPDSSRLDLADVRRRIESLGGAVVQAMPVASMIARITPDLHEVLLATPGLLTLEPYHPAFKLDPSIGRVPLPNPVRALSEVYELDVRLFPGEDARTVAQALAALGASVKATHPDTVVIEIHRSQLAQVAALESVYLVSEAIPNTPHGEETTSTMQTGGHNLGATPYHDAGVDGSGNAVAGTSPQVLMILDSGIQIDAGDLADQRTNAGVAGPTHRKVRRYEASNTWAGNGDGLGCDNPQQDGNTHGHVVAGTALGNATNIVSDGGGGPYGAGWVATDQNNQTWRLDGVAPGAVLAAIDGGVTSQATGCSDTDLDAISPGDLYSGGVTGSMGATYTTNSARIFNFSWGSATNAYIGNVLDVDAFLADKRDAMVFISAGNRGGDFNNDQVPDEGTLGNPGNTKNGLSMGASRGANDPVNDRQTDRAPFSSMGPAVDAVVGRIAPQLMAPGSDVGGLGLDSEFVCRTSDNDQNNPVECDWTTGNGGTSFSSPAAAGAALVFRDYFAQGFYPTGGQVTANAVSNISGALVKAGLVASAQMLGFHASRPNFVGLSTGDNDQLTKRFRFNNEQGYGRIQLDRVLPLVTWPPSPSGLIVVDGGIPGGPINISGLSGSIVTNAATTQTGTFVVCDDQQELRVGLAWVEAVGAALVNNLNLELTSPGGVKTYLGNYFTDDNNRTGVLDGGEDCAGLAGLNGFLDQEQWSLPSCLNAVTDSLNPVEGIFLSPDPRGDGSVPSQVVAGTWTVRVKSAGGDQVSQPYALVVSGGVCLGSSVRFDAGSYACNDQAGVTVNEFDEVSDPGTGLNASIVEGRTTLHVLDANDVVVDTESNLDNFTQVGGTLRFVSDPLVMSDLTARVAENGVLDIRDGDTVRATYADVGGSRLNFTGIDCRAALFGGAFNFAAFGQDYEFDILGGCERNARGMHEFGFPDRYMDEDETLGYRLGFRSSEAQDLFNVAVTLRCVDVDLDSPATCLPNSTACADPRRENNTSCNGGSGADWITVLDSPKVIPVWPGGTLMSANFSLVASPVINGPQSVEMVMALTAETSGKSSTAVAVVRHKIDVDEASTFYSTDFPTGGLAVEINDQNGNGRGNEIAEGGLNTSGKACSQSGAACNADPDCPVGQTCNGPTTFVGDFLQDYRKESKTYGNLTAGLDGLATAPTPVGRNLAIQSPWHFDSGNGGFTTGLSAATNEGTIANLVAQWGEDKNFNDLLDGFCSDDPPGVDTPCNFPTDPVCPVGPNNQRCSGGEDRDTVNNQLDQSWSTRGGCGWQTKAPKTCSVVTSRGCHIDRDCLGRCRGATLTFPHSNNICTGNPDCTIVGESCVGFGGVCSGAAPVTGAGAWHTGRIDATTLANCQVSSPTTGQCQNYEIVAGDTGQRLWFEMLTTPVMQKVNQTTDADGPAAKIEITGWGMNQAINLQDDNVNYVWELDTDLAKLEPVDLKADGTVLNGGGGPFGPVINQNNPALANGFSAFAAVSYCTGPAPFEPCETDSDCPVAQTCTYCTTPQCNVTGGSINGTAGGNRVGRNPCMFNNAIPSDARNQLGLAGPLDNDQDDDGDAVIDEFVKISGPYRNWDIFAWNGPDMRVGTLEDIYNDTGNRFQAAIGMQNLESAVMAMSALAGFGLSVDDMVIEWREFTLAADQTDCALSGRCATIDLDAYRAYEGTTLISITVQDTSPYGDPQAAGAPDGPAFVSCNDFPASPSCKNDCNDNGNITDVGDDNDCDNNGTVDVIVKATSLAEPTGEYVILNRVGPGRYRADLPVSNQFDSAGTIFIENSGTCQEIGSIQGCPFVQVVYDDWQDGTEAVGTDGPLPTANKCRNDVDPARQGEVLGNVDIVIEQGKVIVVSALLTDNGDNDGYADANETVNMRLKIRNQGDQPVHDLIARLTTNDPKIDCVIDSFINFGTVNGKTTVTSSASEVFIFRVAGSPTVNRTSIDESISAAVNITMSAQEFETLFVPQSLTLDLDLNATGGSGPGTFIESFESGTLGSFAVENLESSLHGVFNPPVGPPSPDNADGWRCQYADPNWINASSFASDEAAHCYPGNSQAHADAVHWHVDTTALNPSPGTRGYTGTNSLHFGFELANTTLGFSTPASALEAVRTSSPINLSGTLVAELSFKHQTSLLDDRTINNQLNRANDRSVVMLQVADAGGAPVGDWLKLQPYVNTYDRQGEDNFFNCSFDPADDGTTEDDFFDPVDPNRRFGPSTTCFPEFSFANSGAASGPFSPNNIGLATDGPGLQGATGVGTWVETTVDLSRFRGRRVRVRFLATTLKFQTADYWQDAFTFPQFDVREDGMWVDDIQISNTLSTPTTLTADASGFTGVACNVDPCGSISASLIATPSSLTVPGQAVDLDASGSTADRCLDGTLQYLFCIDGNNTNSCDSINLGGADTLLRGWSDSPTFLDAPGGTTKYAVDVRCSSEQTCKGSTTNTVNVACPGGGIGDIRFANKTTINVPYLASSPAAASFTVDWVKGTFGGNSTTQNICQTDPTPGAVNSDCTDYRSEACQPEVTVVGTPANIVITDSPTPPVAPGLNGFFYLVKKDGSVAEAGFCNSTSWQSRTAAETGRDTAVADPNAGQDCP